VKHTVGQLIWQLVINWPLLSKTDWQSRGVCYTTMKHYMDIILAGAESSHDNYM